ncbi:hypothetical protein HWV62_23400 [Athelia sp. TMB]|nr:hypothetical protein HWV62_23400 [Athelia sp. TMB]
MANPLSAGSSQAIVLRDTFQALVSSGGTDNRQIIASGPGAHIFKLFSAGGTYLENFVSNLAQRQGWGPDFATDRIILFLGTGDDCLGKLDELHNWHKKSKVTVNPQKTTLKPPDDVKKLKKLCKHLAKYTRGSQTPATQFLAFKSIVMLTTRYIGLRWVFVELLATELGSTPSQTNVSGLWREVTNRGDPEWDFFLEYAAYCITSSDHVTLAVEECEPSQFGRSHAVRCVSESLTSAKELSRLAAIRYMGGILQLPTFWHRRIYDDPRPYDKLLCRRCNAQNVLAGCQDPHSREEVEARCNNLHSFLNGMCKVGIFLLQDLSVDGNEPVFIDDLMTLDIDGIHQLLAAYWHRLPLAFRYLKEDDERTGECLRRVSELGDLLQSARSKLLFPVASDAAKKLLQLMRTTNSMLSPFQVQTPVDLGVKNDEDVPKTVPADSREGSTPSIVPSELSDGAQGGTASNISETREQKKSANSASATEDRPDLGIETDPVQTALPPTPLPSSDNKNTSLREGTEERIWAVRPSVEEIYDQLEEFFPEHDLDKPVIEAPVIDGADGPKQPRRRSIRHVANLERRNSAFFGTDDASEPQDSARQVARKRRTSALFGTDNISELQDSIGQVEKEPRTTHIFDADDTVQSAGSSTTIKWVRGELIGKGAYARVYLALNATNGEMIAVKQVERPRPQASDDAEIKSVASIEALRSEIKTLKDLDHPNVVQYLGLEETPDFLTLFLEYVPGGSLGGCLRKYGRLEENMTKSFTAQIVAGLEYLHSRSIIHCDVYSDNILISVDGVCKISDFTISKHASEIIGNAAASMPGHVFWMAPEALNAAKEGYSTKVDIWSLGCTVLEMWSGRRPWHGAEAIAVMYNATGSKLPPPIPDDVMLSRLAHDFRNKCFAFNPDERASATQLREHLYLTSLPSDWSFKGFGLGV